MHNLFEAKGQKLEACRAIGSRTVVGFSASPLPPAAMGSGGVL